MKQVLTILVTRNRPARLRLALESFAATRTVAELLVVYDDDDCATAEVAGNWAHPAVKFEVGPRLGLAQSFNKACLSYCHDYDVLGLSADDVLFRTHGWDSAFYAALAQRRFAGVVYGNDLIQGRKLCTHPYFGAIIPRTLGRVVEPSQRHLYMDNNFMSLGSLLGYLVYLEDVVLEHQHCSQHPQHWDTQYQQTNSEDNYRHDKQAYLRWFSTTMRDDARRILEAAGF